MRQRNQKSTWKSCDGKKFRLPTRNATNPPSKGGPLHVDRKERGGGSRKLRSLPEFRHPQYDVRSAARLLGINSIKHCSRLDISTEKKSGVHPAAEAGSIDGRDVNLNVTDTGRGIYGPATAEGDSFRDCSLSLRRRNKRKRERKETQSQRVQLS